MICKICYRVCLPILLCCGFALSSMTTFAADHRDSPSVLTDGSLDLNDLYAFQSPQSPGNLVMIITVNPFAGVLSGTTFNTRAVYEINVDTNQDAKPDFAYRIYFSPVRSGTQRFIVVQQNGRPLVSGETGRTTTIRGGGFVTAGQFDDPFFFDSVGFNNGLQFTGADNFGASNISAIVLEVPRSTFGVNNISVSSRTLGRMGQFDRVGRPAINTVLIPSALKNTFNTTTPDRDVALFRSTVINTLTSAPLSNTPAQAAGLADVLLPDVLTIDTSSSAGFLNGRALADDVIDAELNLLSNGAVTTDLVNSNDKTFSSSFPYLAAPHVLP